MNHANKSTKASLGAAERLTYIMSVSADDNSWKGTSFGFILHYLEQIRLYHAQVTNRERFSDSQVRTMLQNAVTPYSHLAMVKGQADLHKTQTGHYPTLMEYTELLKSAAATHDAQYNKKGSMVSSKRRSVYSHDMYDNCSDDVQEEI